MKSLAVFFIVITAPAVEPYFFFSGVWEVSRYPNQQYLSYSGENPDSFMARQTPNISYQNSKVTAIFS